MELEKLDKVIESLVVEIHLLTAKGQYKKASEVLKSLDANTAFIVGMKVSERVCLFLSRKEAVDLAEEYRLATRD